MLADAGLKVNFNAPFADLRPGALDDGIRQVSLDRIKQVLDLAPYFYPLKVVLPSTSIQDAMENLNNRQREIIDWQTPDQLFFSIQPKGAPPV